MEGDILPAVIGDRETADADATLGLTNIKINKVYAFRGVMCIKNGIFCRRKAVLYGLLSRLS